MMLANALAVRDAVDQIVANEIYHPRPKTIALLNSAMASIRSVSYKVCPRWVFYRVMQQGLVSKRDIDKFDQTLSRVRKAFWNGWTPDLLIDSVRECFWRGEFKLYFHLELDSISEQDCFVVVMFEARAMYQQFNFYTEPYRASLIPSGGDASLPIKWEVAKKAELIFQKYGKPTHFLFFGDCDKKDQSIYEAAFKDIRKWCHVPITVERVGLTVQQAEDFKLPENPERPQQYQWESLSDEQAASLIVPALEKYVHKASPWLQTREQALRNRCVQAIQKILREESGNDYENQA